MAIRTGAEYLESLRDGRLVYINGERVKDVTTDPRLSGAARTIAEIYDLQHRPDLRDVLSYEIPGGSGERAAMAFIQPTSVADLLKRQTAYKVFSDHTYGTLGRTPDFLNTVITAMAAGRMVFDRSANTRDFGRNVQAFYELCRAKDLAMTHVLVNPQVDRSKPIWAQEKDIAARVVKETDAGYYVRGARMVGTLAQVSNEILNMPTATFQHDKKSEPYMLGFSIPANAPGLKIISRPTTVPQNLGSMLDNPVSLRMDEGDAVVIFDDVFVPWERTFLYRDTEVANSYLSQAGALGHVSHHSMTRALSMAEFMCGLATRVAESTNVDSFPNVQNLLARLFLHVDTVDAVLHTAVHRASPTGYGTIAPDATLMIGLQLENYTRLDDMVDTLRTIGAGGLVGVPSYAELFGDLRDDVVKYFETANCDADNRIRLMRLAGDMCTSAFAGRLQLYERYYQGDPYRKRCGFFKEHPRKGELVKRIDTIMQDQVARAAAFETQRSSGR